jgi:hypothetical protein
MDGEEQVTYPPLNTLKPVASEVWIVDGPGIRFGFPWPKMVFPTRMTVIRLEDCGLFIHSPTPLTPALKREIEAIGAPRWLIGPNRIHYWWIPEWREAYPEAAIYLAPRVRKQAGRHIDFPTLTLEGNSFYPWDRDIATLAVPGSFLTEFDFFHRPSRTLVLTDLIENFEPRKLGPVMRFLTWIGGAQDPDGQMPRDLRLTFSWHKAEMRKAAETMIAWQPERIIIAHGRWYEKDGTAELRRAFRWLLRDQ